MLVPVERSAVSKPHAGNALAAVESLRAAQPYEVSDTRLPLLPAFIRGEAYLLARDGRRAADEFQKLLQHHGAVGNSVLGALARVGLGRALALAGETTNARAQYESFFELWRDADSENPVLRQARAEYRANRIQVSWLRSMDSAPTRPMQLYRIDGASNYNLSRCRTAPQRASRCG